MKRILLAMTIAVLAGPALAQNYGAPRGDYARAIGEIYPARPTSWDEQHPMTSTGCAYGYAPTHSGEQPKCADPDGKDAGPSRSADDK